MQDTTLSKMSTVSPHNPNSKPSSETSMKPTKRNSISKAKAPNKKRQYTKKPKKSSLPNWLSSLPEDVWFRILSKLTTVEIIDSAQLVCKFFGKLCKQPTMFKVIDMSLPDVYLDLLHSEDDLPYDVNAIIRTAVDRSAGGLDEISLVKVCDDDTLMYIADRSKNLKHLRLQHYLDVTDAGLIAAVQKLPMLEELHLVLCSFSSETIEAVGRACPSLKSFSYNSIINSNRFVAGDGHEVLTAIAKTMPQLRHLQLIGNNMDKKGLEVILDGCPHLESLDIRVCVHVDHDLRGDLGDRCRKIRQFRHPYDSMKGYRWLAWEYDRGLRKKKYPNYFNYDSSDPEDYVPDGVSFWLSLMDN